ncbi:MAG TPA: hypothetical protein VLV88_11465 [Terriglobales bacterium]|nr:hypothetical protein [Terriglobales bacterium]
MLPLAAPAVLPFSQTKKFALCPAPKVVGMARLDVVNSLLERLTWEIVTLAFPVFVKVAFWEVLLPRATLPKLRLEGLTVKADGEVPPPPPFVEFAFTTPEQPLSAPSESVAATTNKAVQIPEFEFLTNRVLLDFCASEHRVPI